jgi:hypothetical protein
LQKLAKTCKYGNLEGEKIKDIIVIGVNSNTIRRKLLGGGRMDVAEGN